MEKMIYINNVGKIKYHCVECTNVTKNQILQAEEKLLAAVGCVKQIHPTVIIYNTSSLKK